MSDASEIRIPGWDEAHARQRERREEAFLDLERPLGETGWHAAPLTPWRLNQLLLAENWFAGARQTPVPTPVDLADYLWVCSPEYRPRDLAQRRRIRKRLGKTRDIRPLIAAIREHFAASTADFGGSGQAAPGAAEEYWSWLAALTHLFGQEYGWNQRETMHTPLAVLAQLQRIIHKTRDPKAPLSNPETDRLKVQFLEELNAAKKSPDPAA